MGCQQARLAVTNSGGLKTPPTPQLLTIINIHTKCLLFIYSHETGKYRHFESLKTENTITYKMFIRKGCSWCFMHFLDLNWHIFLVLKGIVGSFNGLAIVQFGVRGILCIQRR